MYYEIDGKENEITLLMLHGENNVMTFTNQFPLANEYKLVTPHLIGFGNEGGTVYSTEKNVTALTALIRELNCKPVVVGFSLGAELAVYMLSKFPNMFSGAVIVSPWLSKKGFAVNKKKLEAKLLFGAGQGRAAVFSEGDKMKFTQTQCEKLFELKQKTQYDSVVAAIDNGISFDTCKAFDRVSYVTVGVYGKKDGIKDDVTQLEKLNPKCHSIGVENAGHNIPTNFAADLNRIIADYINEFIVK